ncbi:MAG: acetylglutamate kinase [Chloroflexota bacterium]|nr:acetylglutamate kinase [Chloroflexota bacterium]
MTALTIKLGGTAGAHAASLAVLVERAIPGWVLVHGGGVEVAGWSRRLGIEPTTVDGLRVTDPVTLQIAVAVLRGLVNARLVAAFVAAGVPAIGLGGADGDLLRAERFDRRLGEVGRVTHVNGGLLTALGADGQVPVVAPIARGTGSELLNVNADEVAGAIAAERGGRLILLTDVPGVLRGGAPVANLSADAASAMLADESASGGMRPKLRAAIAAAGAGCSVTIVDGTDPAAVGAALDGTKTGTSVTAASATRLG